MSYLISKFQYAQKNLPKFLFYQRKINNYKHTKEYEYVAFSTKNPKIWGELIIHKTTMQHRKDYSGSTLCIDLIKSKETNHRLGTEMIDFAKNYSIRNGCNGYLILRADGSLSPQRVPQIFYRKQGFSTLDDKIDKSMDKFIKNKSNATIKDFVVDIMYYPALKKTASNNFLKKILNKFNFCK